MEAVRNLGDLAAFASALKALALTLIQICNDLRLLAMGPRTGISEIALPPIQPGSSIMPGKVNPVVPEMVSMVCMRVVGAEATVAWAVASGQLEVNVMSPVIAEELLESEALLTRASIVLADRCVSGIRADAERCKAFAENSLALATALSPHVGYDRSAEIAMEALRTGKPVLEVAEEANLTLPNDLLEELLDPANQV
jgi:aspartate ammonia-lyase